MTMFQTYCGCIQSLAAAIANISIWESCTSNSTTRRYHLIEQICARVATGQRGLFISAFLPRGTPLFAVAFLYEAARFQWNHNRSLWSIPLMSFNRSISSALSTAVLMLVLSLAVIAIGIIAAMGSPAVAAQVKLGAELGQTILPAHGGKIYLRISLKALKTHRSNDERTPVNVALVLDRSGSMSGPRLRAAKEAAREALARLSSDDYVSLVAYNHEVDVLRAAGRLGSHSNLNARISDLTANGTTALYAGVREGARQVKRFKSDRRVNRVILMSDGLANVGPSSPHELANLGRRLGSKGITVTTIGLGLSYNEDLMSRLALSSDGNHAFAETPDDLAEIFDAEFGDTLSIAAQDLEIIIECHEGFTPRRILGRKAEINGQKVRVKLNQIPGGSERYLVLELDAPDGQDVGAADVADVQLRYFDFDRNERADESMPVQVRISKDAKEAERSVNKPVMSQITALIATETNEKAVTLRDKGDITGARKLLEDNASYIKKERQRLGSGVGAAPAASLSVLDELSKDNSEAARNLDQHNWAKTRKSMRYKQHKAKQQQSY